MSSYQTTPYTHFHELVDTWTRHAQAIETQVKGLAEKARVLGTSSDTPEARARLDEEEQRLHNLALKTKSVLKELADEMTRRKKELSRSDLDMIARVKTAMITALKNYEDTITNVSQRRQKYQPVNSSSGFMNFGYDNPDQDDIQQKLQRQQQMKVNNDLIMRQNEEQYLVEEQINQVQSDVIEINHMMRDIAAIVSEQSPIITAIEQNVTSAADHIVAGNEQLSSAARHQKKYRKKLCWLLLIFLVIAVIVAIVIIIKLKA